ncbi:DBH-like monooxygenase protein 2 homolog [Aplysia californica]|uniref:DBH-like monooxygenase protein 2 homolog n=1 Tax=Aplysia californica TaxID=6500 RepID=A0ABM1VPL0_APLCA|nr:DBH-like monooxygenase protein 2 homolog [Aplysia californica]
MFHCPRRLGSGGYHQVLCELIGFRIGGNDTTRVKVEIHWNNPMKVKGYHDSSGMRFYYQPARPEVQDLLTFMTGQRLLEIPPGEPSVEHTSTCPSSCTWSLFSKPAYLVHSFNHMHYLGKSMKIELFRNGKLIKELTNDRRYDYDSPTDFTQKPHLEVRPGDEIKTTCVYNSVGIDRWVYYGDATSDEMCFGFLTMYPADALPYGGYCVGMGPLVGCDLYMGTRIGECNWRRFLDFSNDDMAPLIAELKKNCNLDGFCRPECKDITRRIKQHPCLQGEAEMLVTHFLSESHDGAKILGRLHSCSPDELKGHDDDDDRVDCSRQCSHMCDGGKGDNPWDNPRPNAGAGSLPAAMLVAFACFVAVGLIKH